MSFRIEKMICLMALFFALLMAKAGAQSSINFGDSAESPTPVASGGNGGGQNVESDSVVPTAPSSTSSSIVANSFPSKHRMLLAKHTNSFPNKHRMLLAKHSNMPTATPGHL